MSDDVYVVPPVPSQTKRVIPDMIGGQKRGHDNLQVQVLPT